MFLVTSNTARATGAVITTATMAAKSRRTRICRRAEAEVEASLHPGVQQASCAS